MNNGERIEWRRKFLVEGLPEPLTRASSHLQYHDNYIHDTRLRLRTDRDPDTKELLYVLQRIEDDAEDGVPFRRISELYMTEGEYARFQIFEGDEIRKNRYFHEIEGVEYSYDVYIGALWGLNTVQVFFDSAEAMKTYTPRPEFLLEVTGVEFFNGSSLFNKNISDLQEKIAELSGSAVSA
ncbi:MAG: hypothetical protein KF685_07405 [Acidobacteria bacterium]|nr:hypothetical protein [Acidobacteriota bacterium]